MPNYSQIAPLFIISHTQGGVKIVLIVQQKVKTY